LKVERHIYLGQRGCFALNSTEEGTVLGAEYVSALVHSICNQQVASQYISFFGAFQLKQAS